MGALDDAPAPSATSPSRPSDVAQPAAPMSPPQAAAAAAAAVAAAAATAAAEVARQSIGLTRSREFESASEFVPHGTPVRDALLDAPEVADSELDRDLEPEFHGFGDHPVQPEPRVSSGDGAEGDAADAGARDPPVSETHFLRKDGGNQPAVMNSIAGLFGLAGGASSADAAAAAEEASRDAAFEEALERVRQSRRDIADKAAKGFSDMKAFYEAELRDAKANAEGRGAEGADVPLGAPARPRGLAWDLDETALRRALLTEGELESAREARDKQKASLERVWPEPWKGSYSPPNEKEPAPAPFPLAEAFTETTDRAPANPPDVTYPTEAAEAAAKRAEAVAATAAAVRDAEGAAKADALAGGEEEIPAAAAAEGRASPPIRASASGPAEASESVRLAKRVRALQSDLAAAEQRERHAERVADDAERRCEALAAEIKEAKGKAQVRDAEARELGRAVAVLKTSADEAKAESTDVARRLTSVTSTNARLMSEAKTFHARRATLERENGELAAAVQDLKRETAGLKSELCRAENDNARLRERLAKAEEDLRTSARDLEHVSRDAEAARREARATKARDELGARESSGLASSLRDAKSESAEMRRRCEYLEKVAADAATRAGGVGPSHEESRPVPGRDVPASRPFSSAYRGASPPAPNPKAHRRDGAAPAPRPFSSAYRDADENRAPSPTTTSTAFFGGEDPIEPRVERTSGPLHDGERNAFAVSARASPSLDEMPAAGAASSAGRGGGGGDRLGAGLVPEPGAERREAFAGAYGDEHEGQDTRDHFGSGMDVHASFEAAAAAREMASASAAARAAARRDAEARAKAAAAAAAAEAADAAARAAETAERARREAAAAERELETARLARAETAAARRRATRADEARRVVGAPATAQPAADRHDEEALKEAPAPYSAVEASRKGREGSGWFDALGETEPVDRARVQKTSAAAPPPWLLGAGTDRLGGASAGDRVSGRAAAAAAAASSARPFATADSLETWSSHVASAEARLMALSLERDQLEGELARMPEGSGRTLEQRRKKANAEKRLDEVLKASSAARHQLKAANRNLGHAA